MSAIFKFCFKCLGVNKNPDYEYDIVEIRLDQSSVNGKHKRIRSAPPHENHEDETDEQSNIEQAPETPTEIRRVAIVNSTPRIVAKAIVVNSDQFEDVDVNEDSEIPQNN